jgi:gliding motility-associated-like protein
VKHALINTCLFLWWLPALCQGEANNWYFGARAAITFNSGIPTPVFNSQMHATEGVSAISDRNGNLLFYSDGWKVWNRNHQVMTNGHIIGSFADATQSGLIVPVPGNDSIYYVFSIQQLGGNVYYSIVNMRRQNGLGEVILNQQLLLNTVCEKLTAVRHCNKKDIWVIGHKFNSDQYYSYLMTASGLSASPIISSTGNFIMNSTGMQFEKAMGVLKNSPDGTLLAAAHFMSDYVELTDFNTSTGEISNARVLETRLPGLQGTAAEGTYGVEFSPDSKKLYISSFYSFPNDTSTLYQFDLTDPTASAIQSSRLHIAGSDYNRGFSSMQLGPDRKIYIAIHGEYLSVIGQPQLTGAACEFVRDALYIDDGTHTHTVTYGLPNFIQSFFYNPVIATGNCQFSNITFGLENSSIVSSVAWNFGDPASGINNTSTNLNPTHIFSQQGIYMVTAIVLTSGGCAADTIQKWVHAGPFRVALGNDTTICEGDTLHLEINIPNGSYLWSDGTFGNSIKVTNTGDYWVRSELDECIATDTIHVEVRQLPTFSLGPDTSLCLNHMLSLSPNPVPIDVAFSWSTGSTSSSISVSTPGNYWLSITDNQFGCVFKDSIIIGLRNFVGVNLGNDTSICETEQLIFDLTSVNATNYLWSTGQILPQIQINTPGIYWVDVMKENCLFRDSIVVSFKPMPVVNIGPDTTLCEGNDVLLDAQNMGSLVTWHDGSSNQTYSVNQPGIYYCNVINDGCESSDTIEIKYQYFPRFTFGNDKEICPGQSVTLRPGLDSVTYLWHNGSDQHSYVVNQPGEYILKLSNLCGSYIDTIIFTNGICDLYMPSAFSPNKDGKNDRFGPSGHFENNGYLLTIYNRWGEIVFHASNSQNKWDGRYMGTDAPAGIYVWTVRYIDNRQQAKFLKGTVLLIR